LSDLSEAGATAYAGLKQELGPGLEQLAVRAQELRGLTSTEDLPSGTVPPLRDALQRVSLMLLQVEVQQRELAEAGAAAAAEKRYQKAACAITAAWYAEMMLEALIQAWLDPMGALEDAIRAQVQTRVLLEVLFSRTSKTFGMIAHAAGDQAMFNAFDQLAAIRAGVQGGWELLGGENSTAFSVLLGAVGGGLQPFMHLFELAFGGAVEAGLGKVLGSEGASADAGVAALAAAGAGRDAARAGGDASRTTQEAGEDAVAGAGDAGAEGEAGGRLAGTVQEAAERLVAMGTGGLHNVLHLWLVTGSMDLNTFVSGMTQVLAMMAGQKLGVELKALTGKEALPEQELAAARRRAGGPTTLPFMLNSQSDQFTWPGPGSGPATGLAPKMLNEMAAAVTPGAGRAAQETGEDALPVVKPRPAYLSSQGGKKVLDTAYSVVTNLMAREHYPVPAVPSHRVAKYVKAPAQIKAGLSALRWNGTSLRGSFELSRHAYQVQVIPRAVGYRVLVTATSVSPAGGRRRWRAHQDQAEDLRTLLFGRQDPTAPGLHVPSQPRLGPAPAPLTPMASGSNLGKGKAADLGPVEDAGVLTPHERLAAIDDALDERADALIAWREARQQARRAAGWGSGAASGSGPDPRPGAQRALDERLARVRAAEQRLRRLGIDVHELQDQAARHAQSRPRPHGLLGGAGPAPARRGADAAGPGPSAASRPPHLPYRDPVASFGAERDGSKPLSHVGRISDETITYLRDEITRVVEAGAGADQEFRDGLRAWLTPELLFNEWARVRSVAGLPVQVAHQGQRYPAALRVEPRYAGPAAPEMELMPDGAPVKLQSQVYGIAESGSTATTTELRSLNQGFQTGWTSVYKDLLGVAFNARMLLTHGQLSDQSTVTQSDQSLRYISSKGKSDVFNYTMNWEARTGDSVSELFAGRLPSDNWEGLPDPARSLPPLRVWFPKYSSAAGPVPAGNPDAMRPAPLARLQHEFPHYAVVAFRRHDQLLADVAASFRLLGGLSENSREDVLSFLSEGVVRSHLPNAWGGYVSSPTLFDRRGTPVGYLRYRVEMTGGTELTGPPTADASMENYVVRLHRAAHSAGVTDAAGIQLPTTLSIGSPSAAGGAEGLITAQPGYQHSFSHTLGSGGTAEVGASLRSNQGFLEVTPDATFHFDFVRPDSSPLPPQAGSPLDGGQAYPAQMLVPSLALFNGRQDAPPRYLPPQLENLTHIPLTTTPLQVGGTDDLFAEAETRLRALGYLPADHADPTVGSGLGNSAATFGQLLDNQRRFDQYRSSLGLRGKLSEFVEGAGSVWFQVGGRRIRLNLAVTRRTGPDADTTHERAIDVPTYNYAGSGTPGNEQYNRAPAAWSLTVSGGAENMLKIPSAQAQVFKEVMGEGAGSAQKSSIVNSSSGAGHEDYLLTPGSQGSRVFSVPSHLVMTAHQGGTEIWREEDDGHVRLAVPTYRTLAEPDTGNPPAVTVRDRDAEDEAELGQAAPVGADGAGLAGQGRLLYRKGQLRVPATAIIDDMAGSRALGRAVLDTLNGKPVGGNAARTAGNVVADADDEEILPVPGAFPVDEHGPVLPAPVTHPVPRHQAVPPDQAEASGAIVTPDSLAAELLETVLSPVFLKAEGKRILRDRLIVEGVATHGKLADRTFKVVLSAYLKDVEVLEATEEMDTERWQQSTSTFSHIDSTTAALGGGVIVAGSYGDSQGFQPSFLPTGTYVANVSWNKREVVSDGTSAWRVTNEASTHGYRVKGTLVYVADVHLTWRNVIAGIAVETARIAQSAMSGITGSTPAALVTLGRQDTFAVEVPDGIEFMLFESDFHAHPELLDLPGMDAVPAARLPSALPERDRPLPSRFIDSGGVLGFGVPSEVEFHAGRGALEKEITRLVREVAPGAVQEGFNTSLIGVQGRINQVSTGDGPSAVLNAGPNSRVAFHWLHREAKGHRLVEVSVTARPRVDLAAVRGRPLPPTSGIENVMGHANAAGSPIGKPGVVTQSSTQTRTHTLAGAGLVTEGRPAEGASSRNQGPTVSLTAGSATSRSHTAPRTVGAWQRTAENVNEYQVEYEYHVEVTSRTLDEAAVAALLNAPGNLLGWVVDRAAGDGTVEQLLGHIPYAEWFVPRMTYRRHADVRADVHLRFNDSETPKPGHAAVNPVAPRTLGRDPAAATASAADDPLGPALRGRLSGPPWTPSRPIVVYDFNAYDQLGHALRTVDGRLASAPTAQLTESAEARNIVLTDWAARGGAAQLTLAEAGHLLSVLPRAWPAVVGRTPESGTEVSFMIYDPLIELSSRDEAIDGFRAAGDGLSSVASKVSGPSLTFNVTDPTPGSTVDRVLGPSVPLIGQTWARGEQSQHASVRRDTVRYGTPAESARLEGLPGHLVRAVAVIRLTGPQGTRWVMGDLTLRTTETPPGAAPAYPDVTQEHLDRAVRARAEADETAAAAAATAAAAGEARGQAKRQVVAAIRAKSRAARTRTASGQALAERTAGTEAARTVRDEAARLAARLAAEQRAAEAKRDEAARLAARLAAELTAARTARDEAARTAKDAEAPEREAVTRRFQALQQEKQKREAALRAESGRAGAGQRVAALRASQPARAEGEAGRRGVEPEPSPRDGAREDLTADGHRSGELAGAAAEAKTELETAEQEFNAAQRAASEANAELETARQELAAAEKAAPDRVQAATQAISNRDAAVRQAKAAQDRSQRADADLAAASGQAEQARAAVDMAGAARAAAEVAMRTQADDERQARQQAEADRVALQRSRVALRAARNAMARPREAADAARAAREAAAAKAADLLAAEQETARRVRETASRAAAGLAPEPTSRPGDGTTEGIGSRR
jgi:hypothetical protein